MIKDLDVTFYICGSSCKLQCILEGCLFHKSRKKYPSLSWTWNQWSTSLKTAPIYSMSLKWAAFLTCRQRSMCLFNKGVLPLPGWWGAWEPCDLPSPLREDRTAEITILWNNKICTGRSASKRNYCRRRGDFDVSSTSIQLNLTSWL